MSAEKTLPPSELELPKAKRPLRVFVATDSTPNAFFESNIWRINLVLPLYDLGHDVVEFKYDLRKTFQWVDHHIPEIARFIAENRPRVSRALLDQVRAAHAKAPIDVFFSYFYDACVTPETIDEIRAMGITTLNWYCNGSYQMYLIEKLAPHFDWNLVPEKYRLDDYRRLGARPIYCQEAANPTHYHPYSLPQEFDVTFVGQCYGNRPALIQSLWANQIPVKVWGPGWRDVQRPEVNFLRRFLRANGKNPAEFLGTKLSDTDLVKLYSRSKINLGFSVCGWTHLEEKPILQIRLRDFEVPMSGGFYMIQYQEDLEEFFKIDEEIVCYHSPEDLVDKIRFYLKNDSERERIRRRGYERARRDHTWHHRFEAVFHEAKLYEPRAWEMPASLAIPETKGPLA